MLTCSFKNKGFYEPTRDYEMLTVTQYCGGSFEIKCNDFWRKQKNTPWARIELTSFGSFLLYCHFIYPLHFLGFGQLPEGQNLLFQRRYAEKVYIWVMDRVSEWVN